MNLDSAEFDDQTPDQQGLIISKQAILFLLETGKWAKILSIIGFVMISLFTLLILFAGSLFNFISNNITGSMPMGLHSDAGFLGYFLFFIYLIIGSVYFIPTWFLYKFSTQIKSALINDDSDELTNAFEKQKSFFKFIGILVSIVMIFYIFFVIFPLILTL